MKKEYFCRVVQVYNDRVLLYLESVLDRSQSTERYFSIERFAEVGIEKLRIDLVLHLTIISKGDNPEDVDTVFQEADESTFPVPEIDWDFIKSRSVERLVPKRRSD